MTLTDVRVCECGDAALTDPDDLHCVKCGKPNDSLAAVAALQVARAEIGYQRLGYAIQWVRENPDREWNMPRAWTNS